MKVIKTLIIAFAVSMLFISCGNKAVVDDCGCFLNMDDAQKDAEKNNRDILVMITSDGDDYTSEEFISTVVQSDAFKSKIAKKYTVFHFDFSQKSYEKTVVSETATKEEQAKAETYAELMQTGYQFACLLNCQYTPSIFLLTKERYVIAEVAYEDEILDVDEFAELLAAYDEEAVALHKLVDATKKGTNLEKVQAIDVLYSATPEEYQTMLLDLTKTVPELDKNNESGLCGKYIISATESKAIDLYTKGDVAGAVQTYVAACENPYMEAEQKQECYYMAAYILASSGSEDYGTILTYLNYSLSASPDNEKSDSIKSAIAYYTELMNNPQTAEDSGASGAESQSGTLEIN